MQDKRAASPNACLSEGPQQQGSGGCQGYIQMECMSHKSQQPSIVSFRCCLSGGPSKAAPAGAGLQRNDAVAARRGCQAEQALPCPDVQQNLPSAPVCLHHKLLLHRMCLPITAARNSGSKCWLGSRSDCLQQLRS